jgi:hypothetical protein
MDMPQDVSIISGITEKVLITIIAAVKSPEQSGDIPQLISVMVDAINTIKSIAVTKIRIIFFLVN